MPTLTRYATIDGKGSWYKISMRDLLIVAAEFTLNGVFAENPITLSNLQAPLPNTTDTPDTYEIRFLRQTELCGSAPENERKCASLRGIVSTGVAMLHNVISIGQVPTETRPDLCEYDLLFYVPGSFNCDIRIMSGSSAIVFDNEIGQEGIVFDNVHCENTYTEHVTCDTFLTSQSSSLNVTESNYYPLFIISIILIILCFCTLCYIWRKVKHKKNVQPVVGRISLIKK
jgi:hypothetical protein